MPNQSAGFYEYNPADDIDDGLKIKYKQIIKITSILLLFDLVASAFFFLIGFGVTSSLQNTYINLENDTILNQKIIDKHLQRDRYSDK